MAEFAIIGGGVVQSVIVADQAFIDTHYPGAVDVTAHNPRPGPGWLFDGTTWTAPAPVAPSNPLYLQKDFMDLFNQPGELKTCLAWEQNATLTDDQKNNLREFFYYFDHTPMIDMTMPTTISGLQMLEAYGLLATGRAAQIYNSRH